MKMTCAGWVVFVALCLAAVADAQSNYATPYAFTTFVGDGTVGASNGVGGAARFSRPLGAAVDGTGTVYVADTGNNIIRKITPAGVVTTLAGLAGNAGQADGLGGNARFDSPHGMAVDTAGNIYVADTNNHAIRKITPAGSVSTLAGLPGQSGVSDGSGINARFNNPMGVAVDGTGRVFVADFGNQTVRTITAAGAVTTYAGSPGNLGYVNGPATTAKFSFPVAVAVDDGGNVYLVDSGNILIRKIAADRTVSTVAGTKGSLGSRDGAGTVALFLDPAGIAVDVRGRIYVSDDGYHTLRRIATDGTVTTLAGFASFAGGFNDGTGNAARFNGPIGVALDSVGRVYIADSGNSSIRRGAFAGTKVAQTITFSPLADLSLGQSVSLSATASSGLPVTFSVLSGPATVSGNVLSLTGVGRVTVRASQPGYAEFDVAPAIDRSFNVTVPGARSTTTSQATAPSPGDNVALSARVTGSGATYQWEHNGFTLGAPIQNDTLTLTNFQPADAGLYSYTVSLPAGAAGQSEPVILGLATTAKVTGAAEELLPHDIPHPNGGIYDQVLLEGAAAAVTADNRQVTRLSFIDLTKDIVQVEFSGPGTLTILLENPTGRAAPENYNQPGVLYMKGHAGIVVTGANEFTNLSVFSVGRANAFDPTGAYNFLNPISADNDPAKNGSDLFVGHVGTVYDGMADLAFVGISTTDGKFGGLRLSNVSFYSTKGVTGVYAPGVDFQGPVFIGNITASDSATPMIVIGSSGDTRITGGDLLQANGRHVKVAGLTQLKFTAGSDSLGNLFAAKTNRAILEQNGTDVTADVVVP